MFPSLNLYFFYIYYSILLVLVLIYSLLILNTPLISAIKIIDDYFDYQVEFEKKYGAFATLVFMEVGSFFEFYGIDNEEEKIGNVHKIAELLNIQATRRNKSISQNNRSNPIMAGFPNHSLKRYLNILLNNNFTVILIEQVTPPPNPDRKVTNIYSPGTYLENNTDVAGIIFEATGAHWGQLPLKNPEFMQDLRKLTTKHNVVMIMDEVICGFRISKGGAQKKYGVLPDLTTMAKIVAGGLPGGAVAGKEEIMSLLNEGTHHKNMYHPGTFNGNPVSATAGIEALKIISSEPINEKADANANKLRIGLKEVLDKMEVKGHVHGISSIVHLALGVEGEYLNGISQVSHSELFEATSGNLARMIKLAFLNEGIDIMGGIGFMLSSEHTDDDINQTLYGFQNVLSALRSDRII